MKIRKNDNVKVISGKDRGKESVVEKVLAKDNQVLVKEVNMVTRHLKKSAKNPEAGRIRMARPINVSNVMVICSKCKMPTRIGFKFIEGKKVRSCKKCGEML